MSKNKTNESDCSRKDEFIRLWKSLAAKVNMSIFKWVIGLAVLLLMAQFNSIDNKIKILDNKFDIIREELNLLNVNIQTYIAKSPANIFIDPHGRGYTEL